MFVLRLDLISRNIRGNKLIVKTKKEKASQEPSRLAR